MDTLKTVVLLLGLLALHEDCVSGRYHRKCPKYCQCVPAKKLISCNGLNNRLNTIPKAPKYVTTVKLTYINLGHITKNMTANLTHCNMTKFILSGNNISGISSDAFKGMKFLRSLSWQQDELPLQDLQLLFQNIESKLEILTLKANGGVAGYFDSVMFRFLRALVQLDVNLNGIKVFNATSLSAIKTLNHLDLSNNRIVTVIAETVVSNLTKVSLAGNNLVEVPGICRSNDTALMPRLVNLNLENNAIRDLDVTSLSCLHNLLKLTLSRNRIEHLRNNVFASLTKLQSLQITNLWALTSVEDLAFNSSSLQKLVFTGNPTLHSERFNPETIFKFAPNLINLDLSDTKLKIQQNQLKALFLSLKKIEKLTLQHVAIQQLPSGVFSQMTSLNNLILSGNYISRWNQSVFENVTSIKNLSLASNNIKVITEDFFPLKFRLSVREINLANNPFTCTCDLLWFRNWMDEVMANRSIVFKEYPDRYECRSPNVNRLRLRDFHPTVRQLRCTLSF